MEKFLHFSEGFYFPYKSNITRSLRIQNHDWFVWKKIGDKVYDRIHGTTAPLIIELERPFSTESVDVHLIIFADVYGDQNWKKIKKNVTFPKNQKKIDIDIIPTLQICHVAEYEDIGVIGMISVSFLDKFDDKKSKVVRHSDAVSSQLSKHFAKLLDSDVSSDYVLRCEGQEFHVHKCILAARSSVFAAMFRFYCENFEAEDSVTNATSYRKDKKAQDCILETSTASNQAEDIIDMKPEILKKMLNYIYSGQIDDLTSTEAGDLLYAADKYQLALFKEICVDKLKSTLSASNVLDTLVLGDLHDESLKAHAMDFICKYPSLSELKKMDQWKSLQTTNPTMVIEVLTSVVGYLQDSKTQTN